MNRNRQRVLTHRERKRNVVAKQPKPIPRASWIEEERRRRDWRARNFFERAATNPGIGLDSRMLDILFGRR